MSETFERRRFLRQAGYGLAAGSLALTGCGKPLEPGAGQSEAPAAPAAAAWWTRPSAPAGQHVLSALPYTPEQLTLQDAQNPALKGISAQVVTWHHDKHHAGYVKALNEIESELAKLQTIQASANYSQYTELKRRETFNASGMYLHDIYWQNLTPGGAALSQGGDLYKKIVVDFGSFDAWRADFIGTGLTPNTGWAILALSPYDKKLHNYACSFHELGGVWGAVPLVAMDVWEHAYYYDYGPDRPSYIESFLRLLNWPAADAAFGRWAASGVFA
ncbi:MAG: superoxide dismutase [Fimbriimonadaceae bacterium]|nr:superoxide dismutase [Fimbriimonadaceae bacterium]